MTHGEEAGVSGEGIELLRQLTQDETRLSDEERAMLALAVAELEQIRRPPKPSRRRIR